MHILLLNFLKFEELKSNDVVQPFVAVRQGGDKSNISMLSILKFWDIKTCDTPRQQDCVKKHQHYNHFPSF